MIDGARAQSFGSVAGDYHRYRPETPAAMLEWAIPAGARSGLDLAAGTGLLTGLLVPRIASVTAVEPDPAMRAVLMKAAPQATVLDGVAEAIPVPDGSMDAVFIASAWHWFDLGRAVPEIARVLRVGGSLVVLGNNLDFGQKWVAMMFDRRWEQTGDRERDEVKLPPGSAFADVEETRLSWTKSMSVSDLIGLLGTYRVVIVSSETDKADLRTCALAVLAARPETRSLDVVDAPMQSWGWRATRR